MRVLGLLFVVIVVFCAAPLFASQAPGKVVKISKEDLLVNLEKRDFFILDVRPEDQWANSPYKIKYAQHEDPLACSKWSKYYPKDRKIVLYCA